MGVLSCKYNRKRLLTRLNEQLFVTVVLFVILKPQSLDRHSVLVYRSLSEKIKNQRFCHNHVSSVCGQLIKPEQLLTYRVGVCLPFRRFAIIVAWLKNSSVITDGFKRQASPSTCMGTGILVVIRAVLHWHNGVPVPPVCSLV